MDILTVDCQAANAGELFTKTLKETGFGVLRNHGIPWAEVEQVYRDWYTFFNDPRRERYAFDPNTQDGFVPVNIAEKAKGADVIDIKEFYQMYFPWGRYPDFITDATHKLFYHTLELAKTLLGWIEDHLPDDIRDQLSMPLRKMISVERSQYRIIHYPPLSGNEDPRAIRAEAHEDINLITLLPAATEPGLQAKDVYGNWHSVKIDPETLVINVGDMLQEATKGYLKSTTHRVVNPQGTDSSKPRLSLPLFLHPYGKVRLSDKYTANGYLTERLQELGLLAEGEIAMPGIGQEIPEETVTD